MTSDKRGSNPGGNCSVSSFRGNSPFEAYLKYCSGSKLPHGIDFRPENQPVYEAITLQLARKLGLHTPSTWVLLNGKRDVRFYGKDGGESEHAGRDYYFVSRFVEKKGSPGSSLPENILEDESPYWKSLLIDDVKNKPHNYIFQKDQNGSRVIYLDVGCSFVRANEGNLKVSNTVRKVLTSKTNKNDFRRLRDKMVVCADNSDLIDLEKLVLGLDDLEIPVLNPFTKKKVSDLISYEEIAQIKKCLAHSVAHNMSEFKARGLIVKDA